MNYLMLFDKALYDNHFVSNCYSSEILFVVLSLNINNTIKNSPFINNCFEAIRNMYKTSKKM